MGIKIRVRRTCGQFFPLSVNQEVKVLSWDCLGNQLIYQWLHHHIIIYAAYQCLLLNMWGYSFEDIAKRAQEEAARLAVRLLVGCFCLYIVLNSVMLYVGVLFCMVTLAVFAGSKYEFGASK